MVTIRAVRPILTAPAGSNLIVVKIETSEPELYGIGCATFTHRCHAVAEAVEKHIRPLMIERDVSWIEDHFQLTMESKWSE